MRSSSFILLFLCIWGIVGDFSGPFAPANWISTGVGFEGANAVVTATQITITGANGPPCSNISGHAVQTCANVVDPTTASFIVDYDTDDPFLNQEVPFYVLDLANNISIPFGSVPYNNDFSITFSQQLCFGIFSTDCRDEAAFMNITNFVFCSPSCTEPAETCCNPGICRDTDSDENNCGACGTVCPGGQSCCGGSCIPTSNDPNNCGSCGNTCSAGQQCCGGICRTVSSDPNHCGNCGVTCGPGTSCCGGSCTPTSSDENNCGSCGNTCSPGQVCCSGSCRTVSSDPNNCGSCGNTCSGLETCCSGACITTTFNQTSCGACGNNCGGQTCCFGDCTDLTADNFCGSCFTSCSSTQSCCSPGPNCINTDSDSNNCGGCGITCDADETCCNGNCRCFSLECNEANSDENNCGSCGNTCGFGQNCCQGTCTNGPCNNQQAQRTIIVNPPNNAVTTPGAGAAFLNPANIPVGFNPVSWPVNKYSNNPSSGGIVSVPIICHGEVIYSTAFDSQDINNVPYEINCWNRVLTTSPLSYSNCLSICDNLSGNWRHQFTAQGGDGFLPCGPSRTYTCTLTDGFSNSFCECRTCGDTKVIPFAYFYPSYNSEDMSTSILTMTVAGSYSNGLQVTATLWDHQNQIVEQIGGVGTSYTGSRSYCSGSVGRFQTGIRINASDPDAPVTSYRQSGWYEGQRCQLHEYTFSASRLLPSTLYYVTLEFRNSFWEIYYEQQRVNYQLGQCNQGLFGKCVSLTSNNNGYVYNTLSFTCSVNNPNCNPNNPIDCSCNSPVSSNTNDNSGSTQRNDIAYGHAWISGVSFQFISTSTSCDSIYERGLVQIVPNDVHIRSEKCQNTNSWICDVCPYNNGETECTDTSDSTSSSTQIWQKQGTITVFTNKYNNGFAPNVNSTAGKYAYLGVRGVILQPNTKLVMSTVISGNTHFWFDAKTADYTAPIAFDFSTNNPSFNSSGDIVSTGGQLTNANQFCDNCVLNIWKITNLPTLSYFNQNINFNVSVLGGGYLCAADFEIYFPMKDVQPPSLTCIDHTYTFQAGNFITLGANDVPLFITSTIDNCDWAGTNQAYTDGDNFAQTTTLSILDYPYKIVHPVRTDSSQNEATCNGINGVKAWVNLSPYILFYPRNPVQLQTHATCNAYGSQNFEQIHVNELKFNWYNKIWTKSSANGYGIGQIVSNAVVTFFAVKANEEANPTESSYFYFNKNSPVPFSPQISSTYGEYRYTGTYTALVGQSWHLKMKVDQTRNGVNETVIFDSSCVTFVNP